MAEATKEKETDDEGDQRAPGAGGNLRRQC